MKTMTSQRPKPKTYKVKAKQHEITKARKTEG